MLRRSLEIEGACPMCEEELQPEDIHEVNLRKRIEFKLKR